MGMRQQHELAAAARQAHETEQDARASDPRQRELVAKLNDRRTDEGQHEQDLHEFDRLREEVDALAREMKQLLAGDLPAETFAEQERRRARVDELPTQIARRLERMDELSGGGGLEPDALRELLEEYPHRFDGAPMPGLMMRSRRGMALVDEFAALLDAAKMEERPALRGILEKRIVLWYDGLQGPVPIEAPDHIALEPIPHTPSAQAAPVTLPDDPTVVSGESSEERVAAKRAPGRPPKLTAEKNHELKERLAKVDGGSTDDSVAQIARDYDLSPKAVRDRRDT